MLYQFFSSEDRLLWIYSQLSIPNTTVTIGQYVPTATPVFQAGNIEVTGFWHAEAINSKCGVFSGINATAGQYVVLLIQNGDYNNPII